MMKVVPASEPLVLLECLVAGTSHRPNLEKYEPKLQLGQALQLSREADSKYDDWAVQVHTAPATPRQRVAWLSARGPQRNRGPLARCR